MNLATARAGLLGAGLLAACSSPPPSQFPSANAALERMHATHECSRGVAGEAKLDYFDDSGRVRGELLYVAMLPEQLRFDVVSPFGATVVTLTSDGQRFGLFDLPNKQYLYGPANGCNVARFTRVPVPPFALVQMLRGEAPVLVHRPGDAQLRWAGGAYEITVASTRSASQLIRLVPHPEDFQKPWAQQRVRVLGVSVEQRGNPIYSVSFEDHVMVKTAPARVDPDGLEPPIAPSGPECRTEIPRAIRFEVPYSGQDLIIKAKELNHNPPLAEGVFQQEPPRGVRSRQALCTD